MNYIGKISKFRCGLLLVFGLLAIVTAPLHAAAPDPAYNVTQVTLSESGISGQYYRVTADLTVSWTPPVAAPAPMNYFLKFNQSSTKLSDAEFNDTIYDFKVAGTLDHTVPAIPKATFDAYDYPQVHYLHIKTQFPTGDATGFAFSEDVVVTLLIDNVAPGGTMTLNPTSGSSRQVNVTLSPLEPIYYYWLSETSTYSPIVADAVSGQFPTAVWNLQSTATPPAQVPIYAWFQDMAGNRSSTYAATATYSYTPTVAIRYNASSIAVGSSLIFDVDGTTPYDWTITPSAAGVASIASGDSAVTKANAPSITVNGLKVGTFIVSAYPAGSQIGQLTSDPISVVQNTVSKVFNLITTATTNINMIGFMLENTGYTKAAHLLAAIPNCDTVWKWDVANQGVTSYSAGQPAFRNFDLELGKAYLVNITGSGPFTLTGTPPSSLPITVTRTNTTNLNYVALPYHKSSLVKAADLIGNIPNSDTVWRWSAQSQGLSSYSAGQPAFRNFDISWGDGFIVNVLSNGTWQ